MTCSQLLPAHICPRKAKYSFESNTQVVYLPFHITFKIKKISGVLCFVFKVPFNFLKQLITH